MPHFGIIQCLLEERVPSNNCKIVVTETHENTHLLNYSQHIVTETNKHSKFDLDREQNP